MRSRRTVLGALGFAVMAACAASKSGDPATPADPAAPPGSAESGEPGALAADPSGGEPAAELATDDGPAHGDPAAAGGGDGAWGLIGEPGRAGRAAELARRDPDHAAVVDRVVRMVRDPQVVAGARRRSLSVMNVMWEDTGRAQGSALGPNISDLTLQVRYRRPGGGESAALMPVIRFPNFTDRTGDVPANRFFVRVGNHRDKTALRTVPLTDVLRNIRRFVSNPRSIKGSGNLLAARDTHFLVSAQAVFLPIPKAGKAEFNPVVFSYQSAPGSPAVLTLLVTRQGTSITAVENRRGEASVRGSGQELYFNNEGQRAAFTAERKSDVEQRIAAQGGPKTADDRSALQKGADVLFLIQVPLKHKNRGYLGGLEDIGSIGSGGCPACGMGSGAPAPAAEMSSRARSDVEQAVLGHGRNQGPFTEGNDLELVRDPKFPIRITVQFYKATSNGVVNEKDLDAIAASIGSVYEHAEYVGSLVIPDGDPRRPTEWQTMPGEWFPW